MASPLRAEFAPPPKPWIELYGLPLDGRFLPGKTPNYERTWADGNIALIVLVEKYLSASSAAMDPVAQRRRASGETLLTVPGVPGVVAVGFNHPEMDVAVFSVGDYSVTISASTDGPSPRSALIAEVERQYRKLVGFAA